VYDTLAGSKATELQYVSALAAVGYVSVSAGSRARRLQDMGLPETGARSATASTPAVRLAASLRSGRLARRRVLSGCDPCASLVWGDFNGDCNFLPTDVSALQRFSLVRLTSAFNAGVGSDPLNLVDWTSFPADECADFIKLQANPTRDVMDYPVGDARYLKPSVDATDAQHLLRAMVKDYRLLASLNASCAQASAAGSGELRIVAHLVGGDGQNVGEVGADPARTDVFAELRMSPAPSSYDVSVGATVS
jgi:hypothetical protein